ncbi:serine hydrolase family protein [Pontibacter sp. Tf4]|uniref:RBBP9/YdeN family alpha/beta hydrolase n=1 Tax=Pontibacter sp. Tf4 TaxID=2761620 RepID=UPI0016281A81|nr:alpha/beta hydrolase [Pontibacter sp. Tf4]MBB6611677.1 serine hydrolase family protein [Pontibacter sp. Tf4]
MHINIPGLRNSGPDHWQSLWEAAYPEQFYRINQHNWDQPDCALWTARIEQELQQFDLSEVVLVGHSVGCAAIVNWHQRFGKRVKAALLVAPSDVDNPDYPSYITGFSPLPLQNLPFPTIVVASTNDHVVNYSRAKHFANCWGSELVTIENAGHIEPKSGYGPWDQGLELIAQLHNQTIVPKL